MASKEYGSKFDNRQEVEDAIKELAQKFEAQLTLQNIKIVDGKFTYTESINFYQGMIAGLRVGHTISKNEDDRKNMAGILIVLSKRISEM
ncbi:MAG: hypothetical protein A2Z59_02990 [Nitrospinae bacterium RIFCSPLOWO2_02_39_17]|nr:MAG: hypothetical protein A2W53_04990 [Nitrospinae bacterium RIFCSPHIGHO2_02_39_11]OGW02388.1 MAG: hypothetical protein A2Z59_02990 [Nitrospinae bacterium RIFCSPLOWO2_02_39_17]OGW08364.1 MAG: hypothetical protein A2W75_08185 [Nitrospinae bacterium RIFCSPLOWO2_12_39_15]